MAYDVKKGKLYWITGLSGAGKTTIGTALYYKLKEKNDNIVLLDGDILKNIFESSEVKYTEEARRVRAMKYARLCKSLADQGLIVICCTIAMYDEVRKWNRENNDNYIEIFLNVPMEILKKRDQKGLYSGYNVGKTKEVAGLDVNIEFPTTPDLEICNDGTYSVEGCVEQILQVEVRDKCEKVNNIAYWNNYYDLEVVPEEASSFAKYIQEYFIASGKRLLELGCGNGRDSLYFSSQGVQVVGVDSSEKIIDKLRKKHKDKNILFVCDDFTRTNALYQQQFDYCYSRFTLHAINLEQENYVLRNVYQSLKTGKESGYFFIEVRSIHDDIYGLGEKVGQDSYIYEGHFRRFLRKEELEHRLQENGFQIVSSEENQGFAVFGEQDPMVIRIVAKK